MLPCASSGILPPSFVLFYYRAIEIVSYDYSSALASVYVAYVTRVIRVHVALLAFQSNFDRSLRSSFRELIPRARITTNCSSFSFESSFQ